MTQTNNLTIKVGLAILIPLWLIGEIILLNIWPQSSVFFANILLAIYASCVIMFAPAKKPNPPQVTDQDKEIARHIDTKA